MITIIKILIIIIIIIMYHRMPSFYHQRWLDNAIILWLKPCYDNDINILSISFTSQVSIHGNWCNRLREWDGYSNVLQQLPSQCQYTFYRLRALSFVFPAYFAHSVLWSHHHRQAATAFHIWYGWLAIDGRLNLLSHAIFTPMRRPT